MSKKKKSIIIAVVAAVFFLLLFFGFDFLADSIVLPLLNTEINELDEMNINKELITEDIYYAWNDYDEKSIFFCDNIFIEDSEREYIEKDTGILKYAFDGKENIAFHTNELEMTDDENPPINSRLYGATYYEIKRDYFAIYNIKSKIRTEFESQSEFVDYCKLNNLTFETFRYTNGLDYVGNNLTEIDGEAKLISFESISVPNQLVIDGNILFEGFIWDCKMISENVVEFKAEIPQRALWEFPLESNKNIELSKTAVAKHKIGPLIYEDIYFKGTVQYNLKTKEVGFTDKI